MLRAPLVCVLVSLAAACASPPPPSLASLDTDLRALAGKVRGDVGIHVRDLRTGEQWSLRADEPFPTASLVKVPILGALLARVDRGELDYHQQLTYTKDRLYAGEDLLGSFAEGQRLELAKLAMLMITTSDNTASLWCQELAGTGTAINTWLEAQGLSTTRVNSRTKGREDAQKQFGWGVSTPREMCELLVRARDGAFGSRAMCEEMQRCLARIYWDGEALSALPPSVHTMSKQGAVDRSRSEVVLVHAPAGDYVFCVITKNQQDTSWTKDNEGFVLLREVSARLWRHFAPDRPYTPPAGLDSF
ncbi:MAG: serine hydrolase [Planctomycetota bacterium]